MKRVSDIRARQALASMLVMVSFDLQAADSACPDPPARPALTGAGMVETEYEHRSFIVWQTTGDWVELRLTGDRQAWTHRCHLETRDFRLEPVTWQAFFREHSDWLHFRKPVPYVLRAAPDIGSKRVTTIGLDHKLVLLDIEGDWIRVEVLQPDRACDGRGTNDSQDTRHSGWVKWRDEAGPWVYVYTRGC